MKIYVVYEVTDTHDRVRMVTIDREKAISKKREIDDGNIIAIIDVWKDNELYQSGLIVNKK